MMLFALHCYLAGLNVLSVPYYHSLNHRSLVLKLKTQNFPKTSRKMLARKSKRYEELIIEGKSPLSLNWGLIMSFHCLEACSHIIEKKLGEALEWG